MSKSKVKSVSQPNGWPKDNPTSYFYDVAFENGEYGSYACKTATQSDFIVGQEAEYELTPNGEHSGKPKYKLRKPNSFNRGGGGGGGKAPANNRAFAASYAKDVTVAFIEKGIILDSSAAEKSINHFSNLFLTLIEQ